MFYYYGRKSKIANRYPEPIRESEFLIEPFAGSAAYSLFGNRWEKQVVLYDTNILVFKLWNYLLSATKKDIENLPNPEYKEDIRQYKTLCDEERWLIGFAINPGSASPCNIVQKFSRWNANKKYVAENIYKIKHWKIFNQSYETIGNVNATWFIDPPYFKQGVHYHSTGIDYTSLGEWCKNRSGLKIVCEGEEGDWLPFEKLCNITAIGKRKPSEFVYILQ